MSVTRWATINKGVQFYGKVVILKKALLNVYSKNKILNICVLAYHRLISICIKNFDSIFSYCISTILDIISNEYLFDGYCRELFGQHIDSLNANSYGESCIWNASGEKCDLIYWHWLLFFQDMENCIPKYKLMRNIFLFGSCNFGLYIEKNYL